MNTFNAFGRKPYEHKNAGKDHKIILTEGTIVSKALPTVDKLSPKSRNLALLTHVKRGGATPEGTQRVIWKKSIRGKSENGK